MSPLLLLLEGDIVQTALYSADLVRILDLLGTVFTFPSKVHGSPNGGQLELGHLLALASVLSQKVHIGGELGKKDHDLEVFFDFYLLLCQLGEEGDQVIDDWHWVFVRGDDKVEGFFKVEVDGDNTWFPIFFLQQAPEGRGGCLILVLVDDVVQDLETHCSKDLGVLVLPFLKFIFTDDLGGLYLFGGYAFPYHDSGLYLTQNGFMFEEDSP